MLAQRRSLRQSIDDDATVAEAAGGPGTTLLEFEQQPTISMVTDGGTDDSGVESDAGVSRPRGEVASGAASSFGTYVGVRVYTDGMTKDYVPSALVVAAARLTLGLYCGLMNWLILLTLLFWLHPVILITAVALWATVLLPAKPLYSQRFINSRLFELWRRYTHFSYLFEEPLDMSRRYIFAEHPHGTFPLAPVIANTLCAQLFPKWPVYAVAANSVFNIPIWRHFLTWFGTVPATAKNFHHVLRHLGNVAVLPGGVAEMFMADPHKERVRKLLPLSVRWKPPFSEACVKIKLRDRKGFVRVAISEGVSIVPMYYFGNSGLLNFGPAWLADISRRAKTSIGLLHGWCYLPIPFRVPLFLVVGRPVTVRRMPRDELGFEEYVTEVHAQYMTELQNLYDRHKGMYGWESRPIVIE